MSRSHGTPTLACTILAILVLALAGPAAAAGPGGGGGSHTEAYGNNLSVPVTFAEGYGITGSAVDTATGLRGGTAQLSDNFGSLQDVYAPIHLEGLVDADGAELWSSYFYAQKTVAAWQADWQSLADVDPAVDTTQVDYVDWGDSLLTKAWTIRSKIRVEIRLQRVNSEDLGGYAMNHLSGSGITEVWGAADASTTGASAPSFVGRTYVPAEGTVYSNCARISVFRLVGGEPVTPAVFSYAVADKYGNDGPGGFAAECNVGGNIIYGYNWDPRTHSLTAGKYRVQFSLDQTATWAGGLVIRNTHINALNPLDTAGEWPYAPVLSDDGYTTYVDVDLVTSGGGGGGGRH